MQTLSEAEASSEKKLYEDSETKTIYEDSETKTIYEDSQRESIYKKFEPTEEFINFQDIPAIKSLSLYIVKDIRTSLLSFLGKEDDDIEELLEEDRKVYKLRNMLNSYIPPNTIINGKSLLRIAADNINLPAVKCLLNKGARINKNKKTDILFSILKNPNFNEDSFEILKLLTARCEDMVQFVSKKGTILSATTNMVDFFNDFIDVNRILNGKPMLQIAAEMRNLLAVEIFLKKGAITHPIKEDVITTSAKENTNTKPKIKNILKCVLESDSFTFNYDSLIIFVKLAEKGVDIDEEIIDNGGSKKTIADKMKEYLSSLRDLSSLEIYSKSYIEKTIDDILRQKKLSRDKSKFAATIFSGIYNQLSSIDNTKIPDANEDVDIKKNSLTDNPC